MSNNNILAFITYIILTFFTIKHSNIIVSIPYCILLFLLMTNFEVGLKNITYFLPENTPFIFIILSLSLYFVIIIFMISYPWLLTKYKY